jgi:PAS domain S-box-containing protein
VALAEDRLALALEDTEVGVFELDFEAETAYVSPSLCRLLGQPVMRGPIPLDQWLAALHPEHVAETRRALHDKVARGELRYEREQRVELKSGEVRWFLNRVRLDVTTMGTLAVARGAAVDITVRKRLDALLEQAQAGLRQQLQDLQRLHALSQKLVAAGDDIGLALQSLLDLVVDLHGAKHGLVLLFDADGQAVRAVAQAGLGDEEVRRLSPQGAWETVAPSRFLAEQRALAEQSGYRALHSTFMMSTAGLPLGVIAVMFREPHDWNERETSLSEVCAVTAAAVVERERARALAAANEQRFAVALESSAVPFNILAPVRDGGGQLVDFRWSYLNQAAAHIFGFSVSELLGRRVAEVLPAVWEQPGLLERYAGVLERGEPCEFEAYAAQAPAARWLHVIASPLQGSVAIWFADVTERRRQQEELVQADRRKDEFLATLAHELRSPLAPIRQAALIARSSALESQRLRSHDVIERQVRNMARLLDDLLDLSRITQGKMELRRTRVALSTVVQDAVETARPHIDAKRHAFALDLPEAQVMLEVDPLRLAQAIGNLLTNASKYTDPGGDISLTARVDALGLVLRVKDSGIGLRPEQLEHVFEMFSQLPGTADRSQGGLGIGLALSRRLVSLHGGSIEAASPGPGRGSEFSLRLPAASVCGPGPMRDLAPRRESQGARIRLLIADDNVDAAETLAELMRIEGHDVRVVHDGREALAAFEEFAPEAALLDIGMPRLSGLEVARAIRRLPAGRRSVLIAITGWGQERDQREALAAGFDYHATKPVDPGRLQGMIAVRGVAPVRAAQ